MSDLYVVTHSESDYLLSYPEEYRAEFGIDELGMSAVNADAIRKNTRSRHVLEKAGFRFQECYR